MELTSAGEIIERQSYLNGTRYYLLEGTGATVSEVWDWTLALTLPKAQGEPISEGDLSITHGERTWFADIVGGSYHEADDEEVDAPVLEVRLELARRTEAENTEPWTAASGTLRLVDAGCELGLQLQS